MVIYETKIKGLNCLKVCGMCNKEVKTIWYKYEDVDKNISIEYSSFGVCKRCLNKRIKTFDIEKSQNAKTFNREIINTKPKVERFLTEPSNNTPLKSESIEDKKELSFSDVLQKSIDKYNKKVQANREFMKKYANDKGQIDLMDLVKK